MRCRSTRIPGGSGSRIVRSRDSTRRGRRCACFGHCPQTGISRFLVLLCEMVRHRMRADMNNRLAKWIGFFFIVLLVNTAYVAAFSTPSIFYMTNVLTHLGLGLALAIGVIFLLRRD